MADAIVKWTLILECKARGWTESYYRTSPDGNLWNEIDPMFAFAQARAGLLGQGAFVKGLRPSVEVGTDGSAVAGDSTSSLVHIAGNGQQPIENEDDALLVTWHNQSGSRRKQQYLRGIWQSITDAAGNFFPSAPGFTSAFTTWYNSVLAYKLGWLGRTPSAKANVTNYTQTTDFRVTFTFSSDLFTPTQVTNNQILQIGMRGLNVKSKLNGTILVQVNSARSCTTVKPIAVFPYTTGGVGTNFVRSLITPGTALPGGRQSLVAMRIVERRPGAPLFESRGRAPAKAKG
jgi:hypothetical protein